jgi:hypothetical protein
VRHTQTAHSAALLTLSDPARQVDWHDYAAKRELASEHAIKFWFNPDEIADRIANTRHPPLAEMPVVYVAVGEGMIDDPRHALIERLDASRAATGDGEGEEAWVVMMVSS